MKFILLSCFSDVIVNDIAFKIKIANGLLLAYENAVVFKIPRTYLNLVISFGNFVVDSLGFTV